MTHPLDTKPVRLNSAKTPFNDGRTVKFRWLKAESPEGVFWAELAIYHHADRKCFTASFSVQHEVGHTVRCSLFESVRVHMAPVARYSEKAREAFIPDALAKLAELHAAGHPKVVGIAAPVAELYDSRRAA